MIQDEKDRISPYVSSALDESWEAKDDNFTSGLSTHWSTRRKVYRALIILKCLKLIELDHIKISRQDRLDGDHIIEDYKRSQTTTPNG